MTNHLLLGEAPAVGHRSAFHLVCVRLWALLVLSLVILFGSGNVFADILVTYAGGTVSPAFVADNVNGSDMGAGADLLSTFSATSTGGNPGLALRLQIGRPSRIPTRLPRRIPLFISPLVPISMI